VRPAESGDDASNTSCASVSSQRVLFLTSSPICSPNAPGHRRRERERRVGHSSLPQGRDVFRSHQRGTSGRTADTARPNRFRNRARRMPRNHQECSRAALHPGAARVAAGVRSPDTHASLHGLNPKNLNWRVRELSVAHVSGDAVFPKAFQTVRPPLTFSSSSLSLSRPAAAATSRTPRTSRSASSPLPERRRAPSPGPRRRRSRRRNRRRSTPAAAAAAVSAAAIKGRQDEACFVRFRGGSGMC
jgi:hypothetical protein